MRGNADLSPLRRPGLNLLRHPGLEPGSRLVRARRRSKSGTPDQVRGDAFVPLRETEWSLVSGKRKNNFPTDPQIGSILRDEDRIATRPPARFATGPARKVTVHGEQSLTFAGLIRPSCPAGASSDTRGRAAITGVRE